MKPLEKLMKIRELEKKLAEADLIAAQAAADTVRRRITELEQYRASILSERVNRMLEGDYELAHLSDLSFIKTQEDGSKLREGAAATEVLSRTMKDSYIAAQQNHSMLEVLLENKRRQLRILSERKEQMSLDEAFLGRRLRSGGSFAIHLAVRSPRP